MQTKHDLDLAIIGNCTYGVLLDARARAVWGCIPRMDGDPVFCDLLEPAGDWGYYEVELQDMESSEQAYLHNSAVLCTTLRDRRGNAVEIIDFAPRFKQYGRTFRPVQMIRMIRPLAGLPRIRVRLRPARDYGAELAETTHGSNHIRYLVPAMTVRLTTDLPVSFVLNETAFVLEQSYTLILGPDETVSRPVDEVGRDFLERTLQHWREEWSRYLSIPFEWQSAVIRAAITLKLCSFEDTGAIVAALTTSIPEAPGSTRNWDYRYCWLRDAYFVVHALNRLGATSTMEDFLFYITNLVAASESGQLQPVYGIGMESSLDEREVTSLTGYRGDGPVRVGNSAYLQPQHDVYGSVVLAATHTFFDERLSKPGTRELFARLELLGEQAYRNHAEPDAGLWELRNHRRVHTFSSVMCWAACDRLEKIATRLDEPLSADLWRRRGREIRQFVQDNCWDDELGSYVESVGSKEIDACLLLLHHLGFVEAADERFVGTVERVADRLLRDGHLFRYSQADDFGYPENAFNICTFWYIEALAAIGRRDEARALFDQVLACRNRHGLLSEDLDTTSGELWGNFPQTYSMVGLISCAMRLSDSWEEAY